MRMELEILQFQSKKILDGDKNFTLQNEDLVKIFSLNSTEGDDRYYTKF